jgi:hypothetical protein
VAFEYGVRRTTRTAQVQDSILAPTRHHVRRSGELPAHPSSHQQRGMRVHGATHPHDHHLRDRCVNPQIQIRKPLLKLATTSPLPTPHPRNGASTQELFPRSDAEPPSTLGPRTAPRQDAEDGDPAARPGPGDPDHPGP